MDKEAIVECIIAEYRHGESLIEKIDKEYQVALKEEFEEHLHHVTALEKYKEIKLKNLNELCKSVLKNRETNDFDIFQIMKYNKNLNTLLIDLKCTSSTKDGFSVSKNGELNYSFVGSQQEKYR